MNPSAQIRMLLQQRIGLREDVLSPAALQAAVRRRMEVSGQSTEEGYVRRLHADPAEFSELIAEIVVPETWFLRDRKPFEALAKYALQVGAARRAQPFRVLSVPCATGEEPYSIAITLSDAGLGAHQFQVDAFDISHRSIQTAQSQVYRAHSFRGSDLGFRDHYFEKLPSGQFRVLDRVRASVHFALGNVITPEFLSGQVPYDVIFCRNLLIYLDERSRAQVVTNLDRLLTAQGRLFVGHAEAGPPVSERFHATGDPSAFAFGKVAGCRPKSAWDNKVRARVEPSVAPRPVRSPETRPRTVFTDVGRAPAPAPPPAPLAAPALEQAEGLANSGRLAEAQRICAEYLKTHAICPKGFFLLAVIAIAQGNRGQAEELLGKVIYLDPRHVEAMVHLAHLAEARGDLAAARQWRQRRERVQQSGVGV
jgi:chemotaxis protein methyltransferase WspC